jgi:hypothetical protein
MTKDGKHFQGYLYLLKQVEGEKGQTLSWCSASSL